MISFCVKIIYSCEYPMSGYRYKHPDQEIRKKISILSRQGKVHKLLKSRNKF